MENKLRRLINFLTVNCLNEPRIQDMKHANNSKIMREKAFKNSNRSKVNPT